MYLWGTVGLGGWVQGLGGSAASMFDPRYFYLAIGELEQDASFAKAVSISTNKK